jgi:hypothetical protein
VLCDGGDGLKGIVIADNDPPISAYWQFCVRGESVLLLEHNRVGDEALVPRAKIFHV